MEGREGKGERGGTGNYGYLVLGHKIQNWNANVIFIAVSSIDSFIFMKLQGFYFIYVLRWKIYLSFIYNIKILYNIKHTN